MTNTERVVEGLKICLDEESAADCESCPFYDEDHCRDMLLIYTLDLLKSL